METLSTIIYEKTNDNNVMMCDLAIGLQPNIDTNRNILSKVQDMVAKIEHLIVNHVPDRLFNNIDKKLTLDIYKIGKTIFVLDEISKVKSRAWLNGVNSLFETDNEIEDNYNFILAIDSTIVNLPNALIIDNFNVHTTLVSSEINVNFINILKKVNNVDNAIRNIVYKNSRIWANKLYLPIKENIYFVKTICIGGKVSFYYRKKDLEIRSYRSNLVINQSKLYTVSNISIELDNKGILNLNNIEIKSTSLTNNIDIKIKKPIN